LPLYRDPQCERLPRQRATRGPSHHPRRFFETHPIQTKSALTVRLPESLHKRIKDLARRDGYSINQFLATAAAEKMSALMTVEYLRDEAAKGSRVDFETFLNQVPSVEPVETDRIP